MLQNHEIYCISNNQIDFSKSRQTYSLDELCSVFLKTETVLSTIRSPLIKALFVSREYLLNKEDDLVNVYLDVHFDDGKSERVRLSSRSVRDASEGYFDVLRQGIQLKKDLETYIEE